MKFSQLGLIDPLLRAVTKAGHASPTPIQVLAIPEAIAGKDVLGAAEAGTGKTVAFALPVLQRLSRTSPPKHPLSRRVRALVITATRDLAVKIGEQFAIYGRYLGLNCQTLADPGDATQFSGALRTVEILVTTPERLVDLHQNGGVDLRAVELLVLDEADRMLAMSSLPVIQRIVSQLPLDRQTLLFTATLPAAINSLADSILRNPARIRIPPTQKVADAVQQSVCFVSRPQKTPLLVSWLGQHLQSRTVVFTRTSLGADRVVRQLLSYGIRAEAIHGEKSMLARQQTLSRFRSNQPPILVATDLAARGIDVDSIHQVVNYDLPLEPETYVHRIGRISRNGTRGQAVAFCDESERLLLKGIERLLRRQIPVDGKTSPTDRTPRETAEPQLPPAADVSARPTRRSTARLATGNANSAQARSSRHSTSTAAASTRGTRDVVAKSKPAARSSAPDKAPSKEQRTATAKSKTGASQAKTSAKSTAASKSGRLAKSPAAESRTRSTAAVAAKGGRTAAANNRSGNARKDVAATARKTVASRRRK